MKNIKRKFDFLNTLNFICNLFVKIIQKSFDKNINSGDIMKINKVHFQKKTRCFFE